MRNLKIAIAGALFALSLIVGSSALAKGTRAPTVISANCHGHNFKPGHMILACGDAGLIVEHLDWKHWGRREANGIGIGTGKTCKPDCASGGVKSASMELRLFKPRYCSADGRVHFTKLRYRWTYGSPISGAPTPERFRSPAAPSSRPTSRRVTQ